MEPLRTFPPYYTPPGVAKPAHCPHTAPFRLNTGCGPDKAGGICWGGVYQPASADLWKKTGGGWWINFEGKRPQHLMRAVTLPGRVVAGAEADHLWLVPQILNPDMSCAIPQRFGATADGSYGWVDEPKYADLISTMRAIRLGDVRDDATQIETAIALLATNYHTDTHDLAASGWLSSDLLFRTIVAAGGGDAEGIL